MKSLGQGMAGLVVISLSVLGLTQASAATVSVVQGQLSGVTLKNAEAWLGIPCAEPPAGELRWRAPKPDRS